MSQSNPYADLLKFWENKCNCNINPSQWFDAHKKQAKRNAETMMGVSQCLTKGLNDVVKVQSSFAIKSAKHGAKGLGDAIQKKELPSSLNGSVEEAQKVANQVIDIAVKTHKEAYDIINQYIEESVEEFSSFGNVA